MRELSVRPIRTRIFQVGEPLAPFIREHVERMMPDPSELEGKVLVVSSKIASLSENRIVRRGEIAKESLVRAEADEFLGEIGYGCFLTIKHGLLIASAGIDESNAEGDFYILYPSNPHETAKRVRQELVSAWGIRELGVILSDSRTSPLRTGVTGLALAHSGFKGVKNQVGASDLFGRELKMTQVNVADALASAAVFCMGEADESSPLALASGEVEFSEDSEATPTECVVPMDQDLYGPMLRSWAKGK